MKFLLNLVGKALFYLVWPLLFFQLRWSKRTRVLLVHNNEILVVKGWLGNDRWSLPGGGVHRGETPSDSAIREVAEELSIELNPAKLRLLGQATTKSRGLTYDYYQLVYAYKAKPSMKKQLLEISEAVWLPVSELNSHNAEPATLATIHAWPEVSNRVTL